MLLRRQATPQTQIGIGQLALAVSLVLSRFGPRVVDGDFAHGLLAGLTGTLLGLSIVLNVGGLVRMRRSGS